jgi:hypothetical protein
MLASIIYSMLACRLSGRHDCGHARSPASKPANMKSCWEVCKPAHRQDDVLAFMQPCLTANLLANMQVTKQERPTARNLAGQLANFVTGMLSGWQECQSVHLQAGWQASHLASWLSGMKSELSGAILPKHRLGKTSVMKIDFWRHGFGRPTQSARMVVFGVLWAAG